MLSLTHSLTRSLPPLFILSLLSQFRASAAAALNGAADAVAAPLFEYAATAAAEEGESPAAGDSELSQSLRAVLARFEARPASKFADDTNSQSDERRTATAQRAGSSGEHDDREEEGGGGSDSDAEAESTAAASLSRRQQRVVSRLTLSELKALTPTPALVELHDTNSPDPRLLVALKAAQCSVAVPPHWQAKRKYLANKKGYEKAPFALPGFLADTGIASMRGVQLSKAAEQSGKSKQRERMRPKMGAISIDYNTLHDAFFRYQTKPPLTVHGELYYEGKEFESGVQQATPLSYSPQLLEALGMPAADSPPPWLSGMQRHGPPPAYPFLRVPGVNGPLPSGAQWGVGDGEWGKPPLDEAGRPRWGGELFGEAKHNSRERKVAQQHWGHVQSSLDEADEAGEEAEEEGEDGGDGPQGTRSSRSGASAVAASESALPTDASSGVSSVLPPGGLSTPAAINLRKGADEAGTETPDTVYGSGAGKQLFTVLDEQPSADSARRSTLLPLTHTYAMPVQYSSVDGGELAERERRRRAAAAVGGAVELALDPSELESLDAPTLKRKYEAQQAQQRQAERRQQQTTDDDDDDEQHTADGTRSSISKEVDETSKKRRRKEAQQQKFKF